MGDNLNFDFINDKEYIVKINYANKIINKDINDMVKEILINLRKKYALEINGFYEIDIYDIPNLIKIIHFKKKDEDNYYIKTIDLKINIYKDDIPLFFDDYSLLTKYKEKIKYNTILSSTIKKEDIYKLCEHYNYNLQ